ncbi:MULTISPECIES: TCP-1/cpn60 chaperonin family protein [Halorussus]|uniref:TCP-1/cpn60 chaperonin family protein n=1 Tax=Halorussus TaxID=1070314 RepID=UPI0020A22447|nr:TCP-1/cpn60 chaperonin family protein [Halorussus vallis]USZ74576.1 TCP-1/cpn60 chaperonin family protein [Halorussus vallis]
MPTETGGGNVGDLDALCDVVRTTLGPLGASKLVVREDGTVLTTSSGAVVLEELDLTNPTVTLLRTAASDFRSRHGDGSTGLVTLLGALLSEADRLAELGLHPTAIERGYRDAMAVASEELERRASPLSTVGREAVARTALTGTRDPNVRADVAQYVSLAVAELSRGTGTGTETGTATATDRRQVKVVSRLGGAQSETELVAGVVLDAKPVAEDMPRTRERAGLALLSSTVDVPSVAGGVSGDSTEGVPVESFEDRVAIGDRERQAFRDQLDAAVAAGCDCILTSGAVNDRVERTLANRGILAIERVDDEDLARIARATGGRVVPNLGTFDEESRGTATVTVRRTAGRDMTVVESDAGEPTFTLFCRAPDPRSSDEFEQSVSDAVAATLAAEETGTVVPGGGAVETGVSLAVEERARSVDDRSQLAVEAFADALLAVPRTLATNAGMDGHAALTRLRVGHGDGRDALGVDSDRGAVGDVLADDAVVEPVSLKRAAWNAATELAIKLTRIDAQVAATDLRPEGAAEEADDEGAR